MPSSDGWWASGAGGRRRGRGVGELIGQQAATVADEREQALAR